MDNYLIQYDIVVLGRDEGGCANLDDDEQLGGWGGVG